MHMCFLSSGLDCWDISRLHILEVVKGIPLMRSEKELGAEISAHLQVDFGSWDGEPR